MNLESKARQWPDAVPQPERGRMVQITRAAWRELGFWYDCDKAEKCWRFRADRRGLAAFASAVREHLTSVNAAEPGEHLHLGPYAYLRITTWDRPLLNERGILGRREDLERLIRELDSLGASGRLGAQSIAADFGQSGGGFGATLILEEEGFDPASADPMISGEPEL